MKLPTAVTFVVAVIAGVLEIVNRVVLDASSTAHAVIGLVLMFVLGVGIVPLTGEALRKLIPIHVAVVLTSILGVLQVLQQENLGGGAVLHSIVGVVLLLAAALGIAPAVTPAAVGHKAARKTPQAHRPRTP